MADKRFSVHQGDVVNEEALESFTEAELRDDLDFGNFHF